MTDAKDYTATEHGAHLKQFLEVGKEYAEKTNTCCATHFMMDALAFDFLTNADDPANDDQLTAFLDIVAAVVILRTTAFNEFAKKKEETMH